MRTHHAWVRACVVCARMRPECGGWNWQDALLNAWLGIRVGESPNAAPPTGAAAIGGATFVRTLRGHTLHSPAPPPPPAQVRGMAWPKTWPLCAE